jgi:hypothetical protein
MVETHQPLGLWLIFRGTSERGQRFVIQGEFTSSIGDRCRVLRCLGLERVLMATLGAGFATDAVVG